MQPGRNIGQTIVYIAAIIFVLCLLAGGGSSRDDVSGLLFVRLAAIALIGAVLLSARPSDLKAGGAPFTFILALIGLMAIQLIPLPPAVWTALPGRDFYLEAAAAAGMAQPWRPISLAPDLTLEAILALLPVVAGLLLLGLGGPAVRRWAAWILIWIMILSAFIALLQQSAGPESDLRFYRYTNPDAGVGLLANRNHQALLMAMGIPAAAWWASRPGKLFAPPPLRIAIGLSLMLLFLIGAALTESRAGFILAGCAALATLPVIWPLFRGFPLKARLSAAVVAAVGVATLAIAVAPSARFSAEVYANDLRSSFWPRTAEMIQEFFPVGAGFGTFERVFPRFERVEELRPQYANKAHNDFLEIGAEAGLFAYLLLIAFIAWWALHSVRVWRARPGSVHDLQLGRLGSVMIGLGMLASITDYPLRTPLLATIFAAACVFLHKSGSAVRAARRASGGAQRAGTDPNDANEAVYHHPAAL